MSPPLICIESEFTRAFDQSLVVISSRWRRWRSDQQAAAVPPRLYSVLCTRLLYCCTALLHTGSHALIQYRRGSQRDMISSDPIL